MCINHELQTNVSWIIVRSRASEHPIDHRFLARFHLFNHALQLVDVVIRTKTEMAELISRTSGSLHRCCDRLQTQPRRLTIPVLLLNNLNCIPVGNFDFSSRIRLPKLPKTNTYQANCNRETFHRDFDVIIGLILGFRDWR